MRAIKKLILKLLKLVKTNLLILFLLLLQGVVIGVLVKQDQEAKLLAERTDNLERFALRQTHFDNVIFQALGVVGEIQDLLEKRLSEVEKK